MPPTAPVLLWIPVALLGPAPSQSTPPPPQRAPALDAAFGTPPAPSAADQGQSGSFGPTAHDNPGFVETTRNQQADSVNRSSATTIGPNGEIIQGHQIIDPSLLPSEGGFLDDVPDFHVVQRGDTLWDISGFYLHDPHRWPQLWSWNEHVTNAHWIFPGDRIRLFDPLRGRRGGDGPRLRFTKTKLPEGAGQGPFVLNQMAFVDVQEFETSMRVIGGGDAKVMMATLDTVYMDYSAGNPPIPGERLIAYAPQEEVKDFKGRKTLGYVVQIMGEVEVEGIARQAAEGTVMNSLNPIERGYRVGPLRRVFRRLDTVEAERTASGLVIATLTTTGPIPLKTRKRRKQIGDYTLAGEETFVVTDLGAADGVKVGNVLEVVRKGDEYTPKRIYHIPYEDGWPRRVIGALLVVEVQPETSLAVATYSAREFERGDHVELRGAAVGGSKGSDPDRDRGLDADADADVQTGKGKAKAKGGFSIGK